MKTYIVQLETHDDVISTRDKISWSKAARVLLVWPRKGKVLERRVDLLLLYRHARQFGAQLAIVTQTGEVKAQARELGIPVFDEVLQAQRSAWRRPRTRAKSLTRLRRDRVRSDPQALRRMREEMQAQPVENRWLRLGAFILGILSFLALALFFVPGAKVELTPERIPQKLVITVWAGPSIRVPNPSGGLPAYPMKVVVEGRDMADSTGTAYIPSESAAGQVLLTNLTDQPVEVQSGSVVLTTDDPPIRYLTTRTVRLPAGPGTNGLVSVRAVFPGRQGNVAAGQVRAMEGLLGLQLAVENPERMLGGKDRVGPAPSEQDYRLLKERLFSSLKKTALEEMRGQLKAGQRLLDGTLQVSSVVEENLEPPVDQPGDQIQLTLRVEFEAWTLHEVDLEAVARSAVDATLDSGFQPAPDLLQIRFVSVPQRELLAAVQNPGGAAADAAVNTSSENVRWQIQIERDLEKRWEKETIGRALVGRPLDEARRMLEETLPLAGEPRIEVYPGWWPRMPFLPFRIELERP